MPAERGVSVVMPVHDAAPYIREAIESVLAQTRPPLELIVVDDGSEDGSGEIARDFGAPVTVLEQDHGGEAKARNLGVERARGTHLAWLDADDYWPATKLDLQLAALADPAVDIVFGHQHEFRSPELGPEVGTFAREGKTGPCVLAGAMLIAREDHARVGTFRRDYTIAPFMDWLMRARELGLRERMLPDVVLYRRLHPAGHSLRDREHFGDYARMLKASLDRRRSAK